MARKRRVDGDGVEERRQLRTVEQVVRKLGGVAAVAEMTGRGVTAVHNWRATGRLPANTYKLMIDALEARGAHAPAALWSQRELAAA